MPWSPLLHLLFELRVEFQLSWSLHSLQRCLQSCCLYKWLLCSSPSNCACACKLTMPCPPAEYYFRYGAVSNNKRLNTAFAGFIILSICNSLLILVIGTHPEQIEVSWRCSTASTACWRLSAWKLFDMPFKLSPSCNLM